MSIGLFLDGELFSLNNLAMRIGKIFIFGVLLSLLASFSFAQGPPEKMKTIPPPPMGRDLPEARGRMGHMPEHWHHLLQQLNLNPEQRARLQELREAYLRDTLVWRNELIIKRFDLRDLMRNPQAETSQILAKQREISQLEAKIQERTILYQLEIRRVLTPEQQKLLPPDFYPQPPPGQRMRPWRGGFNR